MTIDSEDKRRSASNWGLWILPVPDGTISGADKQHVAGFYRGIAASSPWTKIIIQGVEGISGEPVVIIGKYRLP